MKLTPGHESAKLHGAVVEHNYSRRKGTKLPQLVHTLVVDHTILG